MSHDSRTNTIPVIDISQPSEAVARQVLEAASTQGFLYIKNDGVTIACKDIDDMFKLSQEFFATPKERKAEYAIHTEKAGGINRGWVSMQGESLDPEGQKSLQHRSPNPNLQPLPHPLSSHKDLISRFQLSCHALCTSILSLLGTALQISDPSYFASRHDQSQGPSGTIFRMLYYPKTTTSTSASPSSSSGSGLRIRAGAHSDYGSITLLFRLPGQPGLELLTPDRGWVAVPVNPHPADLAEPPILVNIGDLLSFWTNGMLKSTVHRVAFSEGGAGAGAGGKGEGEGEERYSMAYFCHPLDDVQLAAVPSKLIEDFADRGVEELRMQRKRLGLNDGGEDGDKEKVLTAKQHLDRRLKVTYGI
ncbi:hypothetical protein N0V83_010446 [Neocucurbitaria cava]|uniref:Fe2OG dioxygenase domain-containing protein n=1 Tax=Neocucurbitaria cava TaxID=798079 RepID=A0A9W9CGJ8_9PLEO|nr:hypothetical protein N0V83_010446 [Neocucurbitaria cava]